MQSRLQLILALSAAALSLLMLPVYYRVLPRGILVAALALDAGAFSLLGRTKWISYILVLSSTALICIYTTAFLPTAILLYITAAAIVGSESRAPFLGSEARKILAAIFISVLTIVYTSLLIYSLSYSNIEAFRRLGTSSTGIAIIYGFAILFASSITYGYYRSGHIIPQEALMARKLYSSLSPDNGFRAGLYLASLAPSIVYHEPIYAAATLLSYFIKLFTPSSRRMRNLDVLIYSIAYFTLLTIFGLR